MDRFAAAIDSLRIGDYRGALTHLEQILDEEPDNAPALAYAGIAHLHLKDVTGAQELLDRAIQADPEEFIAWAKRGELWFRLACFPQAVADLRRALSLEVPSPSSRRWAAKMLESAEQRARTSYTRTLVLPKLPFARPADQRPWSGAVHALFRRFGQLGPRPESSRLPQTEHASA